MESPLRGVGIDGFPDVPVGHEQLDVLFVGVGGEVGGAAGFLVSPEGDQSQGQLARNRWVGGMDARAGRGCGCGVGDEALAALSPGHEGEGGGHVVAVGVGARRVFLAQREQAEAVGAGGGLNVAPVAGVLADDVDGLEDAQGRPVVAGGNRGISVGKGGRRHGRYDTAPPGVSWACPRRPMRVREFVYENRPGLESTRPTPRVSWWEHARSPRPRR